MLDTNDRDNPINVLRFIGVYNANTGYIPHIVGVDVVSKPDIESGGKTTSGCGSCGGGKVR